jgi:hypothetical protein
VEAVHGVLCVRERLPDHVGSFGSGRFDMRLLTMVLAFSLLFSGTALSKELTTCGASQGYSYFPKSGLMASSNDGGKWQGAIKGLSA